MKIIFLDIDGVLNSDAWFASDRFKLETKGMSDAQIALIAHHTHIDPIAVRLLNELVSASGAEVVLSSTWRLLYSPKEMTEILKERGATFEIANSTPHLQFKMSQYVSRGKEIAAYLSYQEKEPESFVILDDISNMDNLKKFLVLTKENFGITDRDVQKALKILNGDK